MRPEFSGPVQSRITCIDTDAGGEILDPGIQRRVPSSGPGQQVEIGTRAGKQRVFVKVGAVVVERASGIDDTACLAVHDIAVFDGHNGGVRDTAFVISQINVGAGRCSVTPEDAAIEQGIIGISTLDGTAFAGGTVAVEGRVIDSDGSAPQF
jgi:hypothetical protein